MEACTKADHEQCARRHSSIVGSHPCMLVPVPTPLSNRGGCGNPYTCMLPRRCRPYASPPAGAIPPHTDARTDLGAACSSFLWHGMRKCALRLPIHAAVHARWQGWVAGSHPCMFAPAPTTLASCWLCQCLHLPAATSLQGVRRAPVLPARNESIQSTPYCHVHATNVNACCMRV